MTTKEVLRKAIDKATDAGWRFSDPTWVVKSRTSRHEDYEAYFFWIIFSHDFAKAFWGEDKLQASCGECGSPLYGWSMHLQQMVLAENPIEYIKRFL